MRPGGASTPLTCLARLHTSATPAASSSSAHATSAGGAAASPASRRASPTASGAVGRACDDISDVEDEAHGENKENPMKGRARPRASTSSTTDVLRELIAEHKESQNKTSKAIDILAAAVMLAVQKLGRGPSDAVAAEK